MILSVIGAFQSQSGIIPPPTFISADTNVEGTVITATFSKAMANPSGKHAQFTSRVGGFVYQQWSDYPQSPLLTADYPYQMIWARGGNTNDIKLALSTHKLYYYEFDIYNYVRSYNGSADVRFKYYQLSDGAWVLEGSNSLDEIISWTGASELICQANHDFYSNNTLTTIYFAKTTDDTVSNPVTAVALNADTTKLDLTLTTPIIYGNIVDLAYTAGNILAADGGILATFAAQSVTNNVPNPYQEWASYPDSPVLTADYPYQAITHDPVKPLLLVSTGAYYTDGTWLEGVQITKVYRIVAEAWSYWFDQPAISDIIQSEYLVQANNDIYTNNTLTSVYFAKTT
jgi:hypothetical protein